MYKHITIEISNTFKSKFLSILKVLILPMLLLVSINSLANFLIYQNLSSGGNPKINQALVFSSALLSILIGMVTLMTIYRCILEDNPDNKSFTAFIKAIKSGYAKRFMLYSVLTTICFVLFSALILFSLGFIFSLITGSTTIGPLGAALGFVAAIIIYSRVVLVLPANSIGDKLDFLGAINLTKEHKMLTFYSLMILPFLFLITLVILAVAIVYLISLVAQGVFVLAISIAINSISGLLLGVFTNICISNLYIQLKESNKEIEDNKIDEKQIKEDIKPEE